MTKRKFPKAVLDWDWVYLLYRWTTMRPASGGARVVQVAVYEDYPHTKVGDKFTVEHEGTAVEIWDAAVADKRFTVVKVLIAVGLEEEWAFDKSKIDSVAIQGEKDALVRFLFSPKKSGEFLFKPRVAEKILDSLG